MDAQWNQCIEEYWNSAGGKSPDLLRSELAALLGGTDAEDPNVLFEMASLHDYLGEEAQAVLPYRAALAGGLETKKREEALLQLGSTLRNLGEFAEAISLLNEIPAHSPIYTDAQAFLVLALHDAGRHAEAAQTAVRALAGHSALYSRAILAYAEDLDIPNAIDGSERK